jgi:hypothetical protein
VSDPRTLYVLRRRVSAAAAPSYEAAWRAVAAAAGRSGVNAWRFRQAENGSECLEFLEGDGSFTLGGHPELSSAVQALDAAHPPLPQAEQRHPWKEFPSQ